MTKAPIEEREYLPDVKKEIRKINRKKKYYPPDVLNQLIKIFEDDGVNAI